MLKETTTWLAALAGRGRRSERAEQVARVGDALALVHGDVDLGLVVLLRRERVGLAHGIGVFRTTVDITPVVSIPSDKGRRPSARLV